MCDSPRIFLPYDTIEKLTCAECKEFLRCGPVNVRLDGESVCGKCSCNPKHSPPLIHHKAFEEVLKLICFPCKYKRLGCPEYVYYNDTTNHEDFCPFRSYYCPADVLLCTWSGTASQIPHHYEATHPDLFMKEPKLAIKVDSSTEEVRLFLQEGMIFLVKIKISMDDGKMWIKLENIVGGDDTTTRTITYKLVMHTRENDGLQMMMKENDVKQFTSSSAFDTKNAQSVDINSLLTILEKPSEVYCTINLYIPTEIVKEVKSRLHELKCPHCKVYMTPPIYICPEGHITCNDCIGYKNKCRSCKKDNLSFNRQTSLEVISATSQIPCHWKNCKEICNYTDLKKHEKSCVYRKYKCPRCHEWYGTQRRTFEHFAKEHETHPLHLSPQVVINGSTKVYDFYVLAYGELFGCSLFPTEENGKNVSVWYYGAPSSCDNFEYYVEMRRADSGEVEDDGGKRYRLEKCCATENCYSFNVKIPNEDIAEMGGILDFDVVFRIEENY